MDDNKSKALAAALSQIEKQFGKGSIMRLGAGEAIKIRAQADSERDQMLAKAEAEARKLRAEGDAAAAQYYQTFAKNPDLATFLRKLEVMQDTLKEKSTVILSTETEPFDLLKGRELNKPDSK